MDIVEAAGLLSRADKETYVSDLKRREEELLRLARYTKHDSDKEDYKRRARKIHIQWEEADAVYTGRVGAMYCFKHCDVNQN